LSLVFPPTTPVTSALDPSEVIAIGCALQALHLSELPAELKVEDVLKLAESPVDTTAAPIGIVVPGQSNDDLLSAVVVPSGLALPVRRRVEIPVAQGTEKVAFEVWEGKDDVKVDVLEKAEKTADDEEDEYSDEEDEPEEVRTPITKKTSLLAGLELALTDKAAKSVLFEVIVQKDGKVDLRLWQSGKESEAAVASI
jgi:heat shock protein 1/8